MKNIIEDVLGVAALFGTGYGLMLLGYGMGW